MSRKRIFDLLKVAVSVALIVMLLRRVGFAETVGVIAGADWRLLAGAALLSILQVIVRAYRWRFLLEGLGISLPVRELTKLWFVGLLFTNLLPSGIGGDAVRMYELSRLTNRGTAAVSSVFVDRFLGLLALQSLALVALIFSYQIIGPQVSLATLVFFAIGAAVAWMLFNPRLRDLLGRHFSFLSDWAILRPVKDLYNSMHQYGYAALGKAFLVSLLFNVLLIAMNVLIALALGARISLWYFLLFVPITSIVLVLPISFGGLGVREGTYVMLFTQAGLSNQVALSMSLLVFALGTVMNGIIGGVIYILRGTRGYLGGRHAEGAAGIGAGGRTGTGETRED